MLLWQITLLILLAAQSSCTLLEHAKQLADIKAGLGVSSGSSQGRLVISQRSLEGTGFHGHLRTAIELPRLTKILGCAPIEQLVLVQPLPLEVFADPYQLQDVSQRAAGVDMTVHGHVDLESPAQVVQPNTVTVVLQGPALDTQQQMAQMQLPLHARYPAAVNLSSVSSDGGPSSWPVSSFLSGAKHAALPPAVVLARCKQNPAEGDDARGTVEGRGWWVLETDAPSVVWVIPAGALEHGEAVSLATIISVVCATAALLAALHVARVAV